MLLVLTDQIREALRHVLGSEDFRDALSNLSRAHREGKHIVSGAPALLRALSEAPELSEDVRGTFRQIKARHHEAAAIRQRVSYLAEIEAREGAITRVEDRAQQCFRVPLSYFSDSGRAQSSRLVAENSDDARVYRTAAKAYVFRHHRGVAVRLDEYGGGGR